MDQSKTLPVNGKGTTPLQARARVAGHFGELVQGRLRPDGPLALVTLPCARLVSGALYSPARGDLEITRQPSGKVRRAAELALAQFAGPDWGGTLTIESEVRPGAGTGSSTAEVLGTIRVVAQAFGASPGPDEEAHLCLKAEGAVDPLMYPGPVIFASREARVIDALPPLPALRVVGGLAGPGQPTEPEDQDFPDMAQAFARLAEGLETGNLQTIASAARMSAEANQTRNPNPFWGTVVRLGREHGALGPVVSHTGSAIGVLLPPNRDGEGLRAALAAEGLSQVIDFPIG